MYLCRQPLDNESESGQPQRMRKPSPQTVLTLTTSAWAGAAGGVAVGIVLGYNGDYLGFFGGFLGAGSTILAGYMALIAVRDQIRAANLASQREAADVIGIALVYVGAVERACRTLQDEVSPLVSPNAQGIARDAAREIWLTMNRIVEAEMAHVEKSDIEFILRKLPVHTWRPLRTLLLFPSEVGRLRRFVSQELHKNIDTIATPIPKAGLLSEGLEEALASATELRVELESALEALVEGHKSGLLN